MSYSVAQYEVTYEEMYPISSDPADAAPSRLLPVMLLISTLMNFASWMSGGIPLLTDAAFVWLLGICTAVVAKELVYFPKRLRLGAITLYGGVLVWYCHDYFSHWFGVSLSGNPSEYPYWVVAKAGFFTSLFVNMASVGMLLPTGGWMENRISRLPDPRGNVVYAWLIVLTFLIGISPYFFFNRDPFYIGIFKSMTAMRGSEVSQWTVGRDGNLNYSWGGYLSQVLQIGDVGGILAAFFAIMLATSVPARILCLLIWLMWTLIEFGTGSRGQFLFMILPVVGLIWIKYSMIAIQQLQAFSKKALFYTGVVLAAMLFAVQIQGTFRTFGLQAADLSQVEMFKNQGNSMFSEGLLGYMWFPEMFPHPNNRFPGEGAITVLPKIGLRFAIGWIPRAIWTNKPGIDDTSSMINSQMTGGNAVNGRGGTIASSIAGAAYIYYGAAGVVEMGLLFGWLTRCVESSLRFSFGRPFAMMIVLGLTTYLFRSFRDLTPHNLYPLLIGTVAMMVILKVIPK